MTDAVPEIDIDERADAAYVRVAAGQVQDTQEIADGILVDLDSAGSLLGVEVLRLKQRVRGGDASSFLRGLIAGLKLLPMRTAAE